MSWILASLLAISPSAPSGGAAPSVAQQLVASGLPTGTLLFSQGDCLAVRVYTKSPHTHVATVVEQGGKHYVYDSTSGVGVRCQSLSKYVASQVPCQISVLKPQRSFSAGQRRQFIKYLNSQLGRTYDLQHHVTGQRAKGIHCSEYVTEALLACNVMRAKNPARVSPASLYAGARTKDSYVPGPRFDLERPRAEPPKNADWCGRAWFNTKVCTSRCCAKLRGWFFCE